MEQSEGAIAYLRKSDPDSQLMLPYRWDYTDGGGCAQNIFEMIVKKTYFCARVLKQKHYGKKDFSRTH
jgi:hypothetical protein